VQILKHEGLVRRMGGMGGGTEEKRYSLTVQFDINFASRSWGQG